MISRLGNDACDAYLLSESSLFVHDDRVLLITCGTTALAAAEREIRAVVPAERIATMLCDVEETGRAIELTVRDLDPAFCALVRRASAAQDSAAVRAALGFDALFPGFTADDHLFHPPGYSLNALRGDDYCAVHVNLDGSRPSASVDTTWTGPGASTALIDRLLGAIGPQPPACGQRLY